MPKRMTTKEFIKKARKIHKDKYRYNRVRYINNHTKVFIFCQEHGFFLQRPMHHIGREQGCPLCKGKRISTTARKNATPKFFLDAKKIHKNKYDYSSVEYVTAKHKVAIVCPNHGFFMQTPNVHLMGGGCRFCSYKRMSSDRTSNTEDFIRKASSVHHNCYDYRESQYINNKTKIIIICQNDHRFFQSPSDHLTGRGCPYCFRKNEWRAGQILKRIFKGWCIWEQKKIWNTFRNYSTPRFCDYWLEKNNIKIMVEYDGEQHFRPVRFNKISEKKANENFEKRRYIDNLDREFCKENNIILHRIKFNENKEKSIFKLRDMLCKLYKWEKYIF